MNRRRPDIATILIVVFFALQIAVLIGIMAILADAHRRGVEPPFPPADDREGCCRPTPPEPSRPNQ